MDLYCASCKKVNTYPDKVGFREECLHCGADMHICKNCEFHDMKVYNECRETSADVVKEKERANFCDHFSPRQGSGSGDDHKAKLRAAAEALFKKK